MQLKNGENSGQVIKQAGFEQGGIGLIQVTTRHPLKERLTIQDHTAADRQDLLLSTCLEVDAGQQHIPGRVTTLQQEQQFLTFIIYGNHVHFVCLRQLPQCLRNIQHGRKLEEQRWRLVEQHWQELVYIRLTVSQCNHLAPTLTPPGRIQVNQIEGVFFQKRQGCFGFAHTNHDVIQA